MTTSIDIYKAAVMKLPETRKLDNGVWSHVFKINTHDGDVIEITLYTDDEELPWAEELTVE